jgi:hypothetical protein
MQPVAGDRAAVPGEPAPGEPATASGGCLCGGVRYRIDGPLRQVTACHCSQCRRTSGHFVAATEAATADITLKQSETLRWYASSPEAERGFCGRCGGNVFWRPTKDGQDRTGIMAGTLDLPTHLTIVRHIFVADKSDYYTLDDGVPQSAAWP